MLPQVRALFFGMAGIAGFLCGTQVVHGRGNRAVVFVEEHRIDLIEAVYFRLHKEVRTGANVAFGAAGVGVGGILVGGIFRLHYVVTGFSAKLD